MGLKIPGVRLKEDFDFWAWISASSSDLSWVDLDGVGVAAWDSIDMSF